MNTRPPRSQFVSVVIGAVAAFALGGSAAQALPPILEDGDVEHPAIKDTIAKQFAALWKGDVEGWASHWVQAPYVRRMSAKSYVEGWDKILTERKATMAKLPKHRPEDLAKVTRERWNIRVHGDLAWVTFDQRAILDGQPQLSHEMRVLEKHGGRWKIVYMGFLYEPAPASAATR